MRVGVIRAYVIKEFIELIRTKLIVMVYLMPSMILLLFGYGIKMNVTHARVIIIDNDQSHYSRILTTKFEHSKYFNPIVKNMSEKDAFRLIKKAEADIVIIIPPSFEKKLLKSEDSEIGVFVDGSYPARATTMANYVKGVILDTLSKEAKKAGIKSKMITLNSRFLFNQSLRDANAIVPGLIGLVMLVAPAILSALLIVKEKERGTIFNFYASPLSKNEFITAKLFPVFLLHSINIFVLVLLALYLFEVPFRGSFLLYWFSSEIYILISIAIGMLISVITKRQIVAVILTVIITIIPGFLYSGMLMPISSMKGDSYIEAHIFPVMYYTHILYDTFLVGKGLESAKTLNYLLIMVLYAFSLIFLSKLFLKKEIG